VVASPRPTSTSVGNLVVRFVARSANGSPITRFRAWCVSTDGGVPGRAVRKGPRASSITVKRLTTGRTYLCVVSAVNARGVSVPSWFSAPVVVGNVA
jgi:hypothetical protein